MIDILRILFEIYQSGVTKSQINLFLNTFGFVLVVKYIYLTILIENPEIIIKYAPLLYYLHYRDLLEDDDRYR